MSAGGDNRTMGLLDNQTSREGAKAQRPVRVQLSRAKGWRMPPNTVKVDRSTRFGNPIPASYWLYRYGHNKADAQCAAAEWFGDLLPKMMAGTDSPLESDIEEHMRWIAKHVGDLRGKNLACWCKVGAPCHADVLLEIANASEVAGKSGQEDLDLRASAPLRDGSELPEVGNG